MTFTWSLKVSPHEKVTVGIELTICPGGITAVAWIKSNVATNYDYATVCNTAVVQFCGKKYAKFLEKSWHITEQIYNFTQP